MINFENSPNLKDRLKYHDWLMESLKDLIRIANECPDDELKKMENEYIKKLKNKIANYDVYRQKVDTSCKVCKEVNCVCYILKEPIKESGEITEQELNKLF